MSRQTIQFSVSSSNVKTVLFQVIQFSISTQFSSVWLIDRTLSGATTPGQSGLGSDSNEEVLCIPQSSSMTRTPPSDCLVSYRTFFGGGGESYSSAEKQSMYSIAPADWARLGECHKECVIIKSSTSWEYPSHSQDQRKEVWGIIRKSLAGLSTL